jgi:NADP-dependent 3-hydroxy acid dehydrogenase YdfG
MAGIAGKVVAITGASSGIGEATARLLARRGAAVALGARRTERLDTIAAELGRPGERAITCRVDVTRRGDLDRFAARTVEEFGRIDVLVSNAGISRIGRMDALDTEAWSSMIDVNLRGVLNGIAAVLPAFRRQGRGHFVTTVSTAGLKITPTMAVYGGVKNAVRTILEGLRQESTDGVIRTTSVSPGYVGTELADSIDDPELREQIRANMAEFAIAPEAVARTIAFAIEQPDDVEIGEIVIRPTRQA